MPFAVWTNILVARTFMAGFRLWARTRVCVVRWHCCPNYTPGCSTVCPCVHRKPCGIFANERAKIRLLTSSLVTHLWHPRRMRNFCVCVCVCVVALCSLLRCVRLDVCGTTQLVRGLCSSLIVLQTNASARPSARARSLVGFASDSGYGSAALWLLLLLHAEIVDMSTSVAERVVTVVVPIVVVQAQQLKQTALRPCHPCHIILAE